MGLLLEFQSSNARRSRSSSELDSTLWSELPEELLENLLAHLPLQCLARFQTVSKKWSSNLSSTYFLNLWNQAANRLHPWLVLCTPKTEVPCLVYSFTNNTWQTLSLSFLPKAKYGLDFIGSAGGLLLVEIPSYSSTTSPFLCICNPLTKSWTSLPKTSCITSIVAKGMTEWGNGEYIVVAIGNSRENVCVVEVYETWGNSWRIAGSLRDGFSVKSQEMVFCNGFMFCVRVKPWGVMVYNIQHGSWDMLAMPVPEDVMRPRLVTCGSKVYLVQAIEKEHVVRDIRVWEIQMGLEDMGSRTTARWVEVGRMPEGFVGDFVKTSCSKWFECVGVGECLCFRAHGSLEVVACNIGKSAWSWLPKCDEKYGGHKHMFMKSLAYRPWTYQ